jgi:hypothetical protein
MVNDFSAANALAAVLVGGVVIKSLAGRPRWIRWAATIIASVAVGWGLGFTETYEKRHDPTAISAALEQEMSNLSPLVAMMKQDNPATWQAFIAELGRRAAPTGGKLTANDQQWAQNQLGAMRKNIWRTASMADDSMMLALGREEVAVDEILQQQTVQMCATRGAASWNLYSLPPESLKAVQEYMQLIGTAYQQGKGQQLPLATDEQAQVLLRQAIFWKESPLSQDDAAYFFSAEKPDAARACRVRLQFEKNILAIPESPTLIRYLLNAQ